MGYKHQHIRTLRLFLPLMIASISSAISSEESLSNPLLIGDLVTNKRNRREK